MPTFTSIAFDRLIEHGAAKSMVLARNSSDSKLERKLCTPNPVEDRRINDPILKLEREVSIPPNSKLERRFSTLPNGKLERGFSDPLSSNMEKGVSLPSNGKLDRVVTVPPNGKLERGVSVPSHLTLNNGARAATTTVSDEKHHWTQISPALYTTPESTPLPDAPSSFPPSPYVINHKRRGPRLLKSSSEGYAATWKKETDEIKVDENGDAAEKVASSVSKDDIYVPSEVFHSTIDGNIKPSGSGAPEEKNFIGSCNGEHGSSDTENGPAGQICVTSSVDYSLQKKQEVDHFVDQPDTTSVKSIGENEGNGGAEHAFSSVAEFYDAWEELSLESGLSQTLPDIGSDLREIRLSLLMEIEKRKLAEETLNNLRSQWQRISEQLSLVGLNLPADPTTLVEGEEPDDPAAGLCQQIYLSRFVSNAIGRGAAKAEVEMEMEAQINQKNFEIARLLDRLRYFEAVNHEMSQRNQEVVEMARRLRQRRNRRQKWIWGSIATAVTLGSAVVAYSYFHNGKGSSIQSPSCAPEVDHCRK